jgi:hypothetical protein
MTSTAAVKPPMGKPAAPAAPTPAPAVAAAAVQSDMARRLSQAVNQNKVVCAVCTKQVFKTEELIVDKMSMHKACFVCSHCKRLLSLGNFTLANNQLYCKAHYMELFKNSGGKYEQAFGDAGFEKKAERSYTPPPAAGSRVSLDGRRASVTSGSGSPPSRPMSMDSASSPVITTGAAAAVASSKTASSSPKPEVKKSPMSQAAVVASSGGAANKAPLARHGTSPS